MNYGGTNGNYQTGDCQLQSSNKKEGCNGQLWNLDLYSKTKADATLNTKKWGTCEDVNWKKSFSKKGWSRCGNNMKLVGLHTTCSSNPQITWNNANTQSSLNCIDAARCCHYSTDNYTPATTTSTSASSSNSSNI